MPSFLNKFQILTTYPLSLMSPKNVECPDERGFMKTQEQRRAFIDSREYPSIGLETFRFSEHGKGVSQYDAVPS